METIEDTKVGRTRARLARIGAAVGAGFTLAAITATNAIAAPADPEPVDVISDGAGALNSNVLAIAVVVVGFAATLLAVRIGWRWVRSFVH